MKLKLRNYYYLSEEFKKDFCIDNDSIQKSFLKNVFIAYIFKNNLQNLVNKWEFTLDNVLTKYLKTKTKTYKDLIINDNPSEIYNLDRILCP